MHDPIGLAFASANVGLSILILLVSVYGVKYFKSGVVARTMKRFLPSTVVLFLYFLTQAFIAMDLLPATTVIDGILGTLFMLAVLCFIYGMINDWRNLAFVPKGEK
jgi:hypothetical protein